MYVVKTNTMKVPLKVFSTQDSIEPQCLEQMEKVSSLPFLFNHTALMPDAHLGIGASIGSVVATTGVIVPSLVGVDQGCGLCAVKTSLTEIQTEDLKKVMGEIRKVIPVGFAHQKVKQDEKLMPDFTGHDLTHNSIVEQEYRNALTQIGSLGGGNHFLEIQKGSDGHIWIMVHSGSRNIGLKIANHYKQLAQDLNEKWHSSVPKEWELAFLPTDSQEGQDYIQEMQYAVDFALVNRKLMMDRMELVIADICNLSNGDFEPMINIAHNYARLENHFGTNVWVHRKGATLATDKTIGIIPGSMGTKSYIVEGLGNKDSFQSCSHGAGRKMSRKEAIRTLNLEEEQKKMANILGAPRNQDELQEAPGSYKDIDVVMENQRELVKVLVELKPLAVIKG